ncbi:MAG: DMT family transporter [Armatimonadetes bacterium]|nr:DMT family transporter [Anaerolineae bacterium]
MSAQSPSLSVTPIQAPPLRAYGVLLLGIASVTGAAIFIRLALGEGVPALVIAAARLVLATLMLTPFTLRRHLPVLRALRLRDWLLLGVSGVFLAMHFSAWVSSLQYATVLVSGVLVTTTPIWVGILEVLVLKAKLSRAIVIGLGIALAGSIIIALPVSIQASAVPVSVEIAATVPSQGDLALLGGGLALLGALTVAVYLIIGRKYRATMPLLPYIWVVYGTAALVMLGVVAVSGLAVTGYSAEGYWWLLMLAVFPQLIGHSSFNYALAYLPATYISLSTQIEPILGAVLAYALFAELPGWSQMLGSAVVLVGVTWATLKSTTA